MADSRLQYEQGQIAQALEQMTDSGDAMTFSASFFPISEARGEPSVYPYGLDTGGAITPNTGTDDSVSVAALTLIAPGMATASASGVVSVSAGAVSISRGATSNTHRITSVTVDSTGALAAVSGTAHTAFSETRGALGGPPYIPVGSVEIGQVRVTSTTAANVTAGEIYVVDNVHREISSFPAVSTIDNAFGTVTFSEALPAIHTGDLPKKVYIQGDTPIFATVPNASNWSPADVQVSSSSSPSYDGPVGTGGDQTVSDASFTAFLKDGMTDPIAKAVLKKLWFKFQKDKDKLIPHQLTLGTLTMTRSYPPGAQRIEVPFTISAERATVDITE